ncbi:hypothetical protein BIW11_06533, partial [Tropilaelaps mercedesae]
PRCGKWRAPLWVSLSLLGVYCGSSSDRLGHACVQLIAVGAILTMVTHWVLRATKMRGDEVFSVPHHQTALAQGAKRGAASTIKTSAGHRKVVIFV